jgi:hypothetical protein
VAIVKVTTGTEDSAQHRLETWTYDAGANQWTKINPAQEPDASGSRARQLIFAPELGVAVLENCPGKPREQQLWTLRLADAPLAAAPPPASPRSEPRIVEDAVVSVLSPTRVELTWKAPENARIAGYHIERAVVDVFSEDQLVRLKKQTPALAEPSVGALRRIGPFTRLTTEPVRTTMFTDTRIDLSKPQSVDGDPIYERKFSREQFDDSGRPYRFGVFAYRIHAVNGAVPRADRRPRSLPFPPLRTGCSARKRARRVTSSGRAIPGKRSRAIAFTA